jgi:hypothetical protein
VRLLLIVRVFGRQLCRIGLHRWRRVREITALDLKGANPRPDGGIEVQFWTTGDRYVIRCKRPGCRHERSA